MFTLEQLSGAVEALLTYAPHRQLLEPLYSGAEYAIRTTRV